MATKSVTGERPNIDRIAGPWLIRRIIGLDAEFLHVPAEEALAVAAERGATPYDIPGDEPLSHHRELCSFDAFIAEYKLTDRTLQTRAVIVRGADTARHDLAPQAAGLHAISIGPFVNFPDQHTMPEQGMVIYGALYTRCRSLRGEIHNHRSTTEPGRQHGQTR